MSRKYFKITIPMTAFIYVLFIAQEIIELLFKKLDSLNPFRSKATLSNQKYFVDLTVNKIK